MNEAPAPLTENRSVRSARFQNHLHRFKNQVRRRWWVVPLAVLIGLGFQGYRLYTAPPAFTSQGRMILNIRVQTSTGAGNSYSEFGEMNNFFNTQMQLMMSETVRRKAIVRVRATKPDLKEIPVTKTISLLQKSSIFALTATGEEPEFTTAYLQACMDEYMIFKKEMRGEASESTLSGIMAELTRLEKDLRRGEDELLTFQSSNSVVILEEVGSTAAKRLGQLTDELAKLQAELQLLKSLSLEQNLERQSTGAARPADKPDDSGALSTLVGTDADYMKVKQEIQLLKFTLKDAAEHFRPKHPRMVELQERITQKEKLLDIFKGQSREKLVERQGSIELQIESLKKGIGECETRSLDVSRKMAEYQKIKGNNLRLQGLYDRLQATMQTLSTDRDINPETVRVLEPATPARPNTDNAVNSLLIAAAVGLVIALCLLLLLDRFDDRMTSFTDLQDIFDEPVLCQVPREIILNQSGKLDLIRAQDERHAFAEAYRNLRSSLLYMGEDGKLPKLLLVTSSIPGEGKSVTAANLGITLAEAGARVLIVDGDLRKGTLHEYFDKAAAPGLTEILTREGDWKALAHLTGTPNLSVITRGGWTARNPSELFLSPPTKSLLAELNSYYDVVLMDSAPVMAADDVATFAPLADGVVFVIRANFTSARIARAALDLLYQRRVNILGLTLNAVAADSSEYYFYKYKSYYTDSPKRAK